MYELFTDSARRVMQLANQEAQRFNHEYISTEHILLGLLKEGSGIAANVLKNLDVDLRVIRHEVEKLVQSGPDMITMGKLPQTPRAKKVIEYAMAEARNFNHSYVGTEHILLGLLREKEGAASQVLMNLGLKLEEVREEVLLLIGGAAAARTVESVLDAAPATFTMSVTEFIAAATAMVPLICALPFNEMAAQLRKLKQTNPLLHALVKMQLIDCLFDSQ